ncbi:MAG: hypothetical protein PHZ02_08165 [Desulfocapsaceae bacterium]|nr:hypothetical protein [Desulfocapsaceae bacterium]
MAIFTIITQTTGGSTRIQGVGLGSNCQETATPERSGSREKTGGRTGTKVLTGGIEIDTAITNVIDLDLLAVTSTEGFCQKIYQM